MKDTFSMGCGPISATNASQGLLSGCNSHEEAKMKRQGITKEELWSQEWGEPGNVCQAAILCSPCPQGAPSQRSQKEHTSYLGLSIGEA